MLRFEGTVRQFKKCAKLCNEYNLANKRLADFSELDRALHYKIQEFVKYA